MATEDLHSGSIKAMLTTDRLPTQTRQKSSLHNSPCGEEFERTKTRPPKTQVSEHVRQKDRNCGDVQFGYHIGLFGYDRFHAF